MGNDQGHESYHSPFKVDIHNQDFLHIGMDLKILTRFIGGNKEAYVGELGLLE